jgi:cell fate (sporulation/competence/biofilm development) regulator YlbF (YheA/YmcA/DUF963 family)
MPETPATLPATVFVAADDLIAALQETEAVAAFQRAKQAMDADPTTQSLLNDFQMAQMAFRQKQANQTLTQDDIDRIRALQQQIQADPQIAAFSTAQFPVRTLLDELAAEFSDNVGFDFATLANVSSC